MNNVPTGGLTAQLIIDCLKLKPHPEGGYYREVYRAGETIARSALPDRYNGARSHATSIYYLLAPETFSTMHQVASDEMFHFYLGDPIEQLRLFPDGSSEIKILGQNIAEGQHLQLLVPHGVWQGARLIPGGRFALLGASVAPGFDFADYIEGLCQPLAAAYPQHHKLIAALTRQ